MHAGRSTSMRMRAQPIRCEEGGGRGAARQGDGAVGVPPPLSGWMAVVLWGEGAARQLDKVIDRSLSHPPTPLPHTGESSYMPCGASTGHRKCEPAAMCVDLNPPTPPHTYRRITLHAMPMCGVSTRL